MLRALLLTLALAFTATSPAAAPTEAERSIPNALARQSEAWNKADLPAFVSTYALHCTFVGKQIVSGRDQVLARYRRSYPTGEKMGKLSLHLDRVTDIDPGQSAFAIGRFHLDRPAAAGGNADGIFTLVFRKIDGQWLIVLDHTS